MSCSPDSGCTDSGALAYPPPPLAARHPRPQYEDPAFLARHCSDRSEVSETFYFLTLDGEGRDVPQVLDEAMLELAEYATQELQRELLELKLEVRELMRKRKADAQV